MRNTEVFNDYDMVVSVTQRAINDQLTQLAKLNVIPSTLVVIRQNVNGKFVYSQLQSPDEIPRDPKGVPTVECISGPIKPQITIAESGTNVGFLIQFLSGMAYFRDFDDPNFGLKGFDMTGWIYAVNITLDLKAVEMNDIDNKIKVPDFIKKQLHDFMTDQFTVSHLFLDFNSVNLVRFDPTKTQTTGLSDPGQDLFIEFMVKYLNFLINNQNPYILGYSVTATGNSKTPPDQNVPDSLKPVGTTFTMYHDPQHPNLSNLNFVLATRGGHGKINGSPGNFDTNWITPQEQCDAKLIYSHNVLIEEFVLKPVFNQISNGVYQQIRNSVDVAPGNSYQSARSASSNGYNFSISNVTGGDDRYVNNFSVDIQNSVQHIALNFKGNLFVYKEKDTNLGLCHANASASITVGWSAGIFIAPSKNKKGQPTLAVSNTFKIDNTRSDSDENPCAEAAKFLSDAFGTFLDSITGFKDDLFFSRLFQSVIGLDPRVGAPAVALGNLPTAFQSVILLPAGGVFFFKNAAADPQANLSLELTYKSAN